MINELVGSIGDAIDRLDYLQDLGINCVEGMPVSNVSNTVDWGFLPIGYFGVDERFGKRCHMQRFVDAAHRRGIAVILDVVYGHTSDQFPYCYLYDRLHYTENPFMGPFAKDYFGRSTDFNRLITQDFFFTVNYHWLESTTSTDFGTTASPTTGTALWGGVMPPRLRDLQLGQGEGR
jgi:1,4-alpha-glucan branching enzyme